MPRLSFATLLVAGLAAMAAPAPTGAITSTYDKLSFLTFTAPVQVPGVTLGPGTYRFRLANPESSRNVLQVLSNDGSTVYSMFHTIPDARVTITEQPTVTFRETPAGVAPAVKSFFYPGEHRGYEFVYPKGGPIMTAPRQPDIAYTPLPAPVIPEAIVAPEPVAALPADVAPVLEPAPEPVELPRTASPLPVAGLGGFVLLVAGLGAGLIRRALN